ncbi:MAG TPA: carboxylating nicotinate-nucleotide diphosphorylase [Thermoanaerobaculia bacterium]|nr:carboxylating nicotinate-nucleotide diphosphorylase [Thermoanaerobaculia bacterium]
MDYSPSRMIPLAGEALDEKLREFLAEDVGGGDVTSEWTVPVEARARGRLIARSACVVSGLPVARRTFELLDSRFSWEGEAAAGSAVEPETTLASLSGRARPILTAERVALNLLQRMCGIATATRRYVEAVAGTDCRVLDTRKTAPGLRAFDRMAVADGGGCNHRDGLFDMVLVKDNHRRLAGGVAAAVSAARRKAPLGMKIEVEVESEEDLYQALEARVEMILIDNQSPETVARWSRIARESAAPPFLEASGSMTLGRVREYALAGADAVSVGALTHSVMAADIALELEPDE